MNKTARNVLIVVGVVVLLVIVVGAGANMVLGRGIMSGHPMMRPGFGMMRGFGFPWGGGLLMFLFAALLVIGGVVWLVSSFTRGTQTPHENMPTTETPLDILKRRYANGEITKEQFAEMKRDIGA